MIVSRFPTTWRTTVTVTRQGRDQKGNPLPPTSHTVADCMAGWRATTDPVDRADLTSDDAVLYVDDPLADIAEGDRISVPAGPWASGVWFVDGSPKRWPLGLEVPLRKGI